MTTTGTTTGINAIGITKMKNALNDYINVVKARVYTEPIPSEIQNGIQGAQSVKALQTLNDNINNELADFTNKLKKFDTILDNVNVNYHNFDQNNDAFSNAISKVKSSSN